MGLLDRLLSVFGSKSVPEGAYHPGPYHIMGPNGGILPAAWGHWNHWQMDLDPLPGCRISAMVEACVSAYAQTVAMCPMVHWRDLENGGREQVTTSALSRIARTPNDYQTRSDFLLNLVRSLYLDGNGYAWALRNDRFEIASLHGMDPRQCRAQVIDGEIFYSLGGNSVIDGRIASLQLDRDSLNAVPARNVLHVRLNSIDDVLHGETPLVAAYPAVAASAAITAQNINFFKNQARPSGVITTDLRLTPTQVEEFKTRWNESVQGLNSGGTPILTSGLKFQPITVSAKDTQVAETLKLSDAQIAEVFRIPLAIVGSEQQPMGSTEALMNFWISGGLGFALDRVELAYDALFRLPSNEYSELDSRILLRSNLKDKVDAYAQGTLGGIFAPNEARREFSLPKAKAGDEPRVQQQVVPLSFATKPPPPPAAPAPPGPPVGAQLVRLYDIDRVLERADQPRDERGRFSFSSGGLSTAAEWVQSLSAKEAISNVANSHFAREALIFGINSVLAHGSQMHGSFLDSHVEQQVALAVNHFAEHAAITVALAREQMRGAVEKLISLRSAQVLAKHRQRQLAAEDQVLELLHAILRALDGMKIPDAAA